MKKIAVISLAVLVLVCVLSACISNNALSLDEFKDILIEKGYGEDDIYDVAIGQDGMVRWVGIADGRRKYACLFNYEGAPQKAKEKQKDSESYFEKCDYYYSAIVGDALFVAAADTEHREDIMIIVEAAGY